MRQRNLLVGLGAAGAVAAVVVAGIALRGGGGSQPDVAEVLDARHTVAFVSVEGVPELLRRFDEVFGRLPAAVRQRLPAGLDPARRAAALGFDPGTAAGWESVGFDGEPAGALVLDDRVRAAAALPAPLVLARVTDRGRFLDWLSRRTGTPVDAGAQDDPGVRQLTVAGTAVLSGKRHGWTALAQGMAADQGFAQFVTGDGPVLANDAAFRAATAEAPPGARLVAYVAADGVGRLVAGSRVATLAAAVSDTLVSGAQAHFARLFRAAAVHAGPQGGGLRLVATADGVQVLRQILEPDHPAPDLGRYVPATDQAVLRLSLDLDHVFDGVIGLLPPQAIEARGMVAGGRLALSLMAGIGWGDVTRALSGHAVAALDVRGLVGWLREGGLPRFEWRVVLAVKDGAAADALLAKAARLLGKRTGVTVRDVAVAGGHKGIALEVPLAGAVFVRAGDVVVGGPDVAAVERILALPPQDSLSATPLGPSLAGGAVLACLVDLTPLLGDTLAARATTPCPPGQECATEPLWLSLLAAVAPPASAAGQGTAPSTWAGLRVAIDDQGLQAEAIGAGPALGLALGGVAALATSLVSDGLPTAGAAAPP